MRSVCKAALALFLLLSVAPVPALAGAPKTLTLWYPAGDLTIGKQNFEDKTLFAEFEAKHNVKVQVVGLDYDTRGVAIVSLTPRTAPSRYGST